jgi:hypothetical protein
MESVTGASDSGLSIRELEARITELAGHLNAANHRWLVLIAEFDRRHGWSDGFTHSCAHWLSWKCGLELGAAREKVRVARALENLPRISASMARGELSYSKVRALTRVATPATEEVLLNVALHGTTHHVEMLVRQYRRVQEVEELSREARQFQNRRLTYFHDDDGSLVVRVQLPAEAGAVLLKALAAALPDIPLPPDERDVARAGASGVTDESRRPGASAETPDKAESSRCETDGEDEWHVSAETPRGKGTACDAHGEDDVHGSAHCEDPLHVSAETSPRRPTTLVRDSSSLAARRADALIVLAESFLQHGVEALRGGDRQQIVIHVDESTLNEREPGRCEFDDGPAMAVETARRLACDASIVKITEDERGDPLNVGRKTRSIPPALRRALASRDQGCVFPGCSHKRFVDGHHIQHWAQGGETRLSNLVSLCRFHHRAVHEGGVRIERLDDGAWRFVNRLGEALVSCAPGRTQPLGDWTQLPAMNAEHGIDIDARTAATRWRGERMDYGIAIDALLYRSRRAADAGEHPS